MKPHEWMAKPTAQKEWIERRGILLWLAFFFIELGAGAFVVGSIFNSFAAMVAGWLICGVIGGGAHILNLGQPQRVWRMMKRPGSSWVSRGLIFVTLFLILGFLDMMVLRAGISSSPILTVLADIFALCTIVYGGFAMNCVNGIPLWNTAALPVLYGVSGIWGGASLTMGITIATGSATTLAISLEEWVRLLLIAYVILLAAYLMSVRYTNPTGRISVQEIVSGKFKGLIWLGVVTLGLVIPIIVIAASLLAGIEKTPVEIFYLAILCEMVGDLTLRYLILKDGLYSPLVPSNAYLSAAG
jgi:formate-dependent nitrite reductase membrane component NrfD